MKMIDFKNGVFAKMSVPKKPMNVDAVIPLLVEGEEIISEYASVRDSVIFTNKRVIAINVQGLLGAKKDFSSLPYSKIQAFSIETAGTFDLDAELELYFSGLGKVKFEFLAGSNIVEIGKMISNYVL